MIRRLKKVTSQAELQQLIDAGIIVSPYIAFDSSSNVTNMVLPADREISEIDYEQEVSGPVKLVGAITPEYYVQEGYTACRLSFTVNAEHITDHDNLFLLMCQKAWFDNELANSEYSKETWISTYLTDAYNNTEKTLNFTYAYAVQFNLRSAFPFDTDVPCLVAEENMTGDDLMWVPYDNSYPTDNTYYLFYGYSVTGHPDSFDIVGEVAQYRVMPYLSDSSTFVYDGIDLTAYEKLDPSTGESMGQYRNFEARVPGNTLYDRARYAWILDGDDWADAMAENSRTAVCDATTTFSFSDNDAPEYINETDQTLEGFIIVQLYNSVTGDESEIIDFSAMYVEPSGEGGDDSSTADGSIYLTRAISHTEYIPQDGNEGWYSTQLTFDASADVLTNAIVYPGYIDDEYYDPENWGDATGVVYKFVRKSAWDYVVSEWGHDPEELTPKQIQFFAYNFIEGSVGDEWFGTEEVLDSSNNHIGYISNEEDETGAVMEMTINQGDYEEYPQDYTYYLIAAYIFDPDNLEEYEFAVQYSYKIGEYVLPYYSGEDSSADVSLGYKFAVGQNNTGYFNTGYVPGADTVVQLKGKIIDDGASAHGIKGSPSDWMYRIFGYGGDVYCDRMDDRVRIVAAVNDIENTSHEYEFGNYYIKVDGVTEATDSESDLSNFYTELSLLVFATSQMGAMGETILDTLAAQGTEIEYFKILEPDGNGGLNLEMDLRPALDASGNICLYDQVSGEAIYPEGGVINIVATEIGGDDTPDASVYSTAYISSFEHDQDGDWQDGDGNLHEQYYPEIYMENTNTSWNYFQLGMYRDGDFEQSGFAEFEDFIEDVLTQSFIDCDSIFDGSDSATFNASAYLGFDMFEANTGTTFKFVGRYVNGYVHTVQDEWENEYEELVIEDSDGYIDLGQYPEPEPEVMFDSDSDDGLGTITFNAYLNTQADDAGMYYKVAVTSNSDWDAFVAKEGANADYNDYLMICLEEDAYTGTEDNPDSITVNYPTPSEGFDSGDVNVVLFDDQDEIVSYWTVIGWVWPSM